MTLFFSILISNRKSLMWKWFIFLCVYYIVHTPVPKGLVATNFEHGVLQVGDWEHTVPKSINRKSLHVYKKNGFLVFQFEYRSFSK